MGTKNSKSQSSDERPRGFFSWLTDGLLGKAAESSQRTEHDRLIKELERKHDETLRRQKEEFNSIIRNLTQERLSIDIFFLKI